MKSSPNVPYIAKRFVKNQIFLKYDLFVGNKGWERLVWPVKCKILITKFNEFLSRINWFGEALNDSMKSC